VRVCALDIVNLVHIFFLQLSFQKLFCSYYIICALSLIIRVSILQTLVITLSIPLATLFVIKF